MIQKKKKKYLSYIQLRILITPFGIFKLFLHITVFISATMALSYSIY
jgi:hypothetical protein